jgi:hypothetical protein
MSSPAGGGGGRGRGRGRRTRRHKRCVKKTRRSRR